MAYPAAAQVPKWKKWQAQADTLYSRKDYAKAVQYFRKACKGGHADGCFNLGAMYSKGSGLLRDDAKASEFFQKGH